MIKIIWITLIRIGFYLYLFEKSFIFGYNLIEIVNMSNNVLFVDNDIETTNMIATIYKKEWNIFIANSFQECLFILYK